MFNFFKLIFMFFFTFISHLIFYEIKYFNFSNLLIKD